MALHKVGFVIGQYVCKLKSSMFTRVLRFSRQLHLIFMLCNLTTRDQFDIPGINFILAAPA
jgi:hypothetical protein